MRWLKTQNRFCRNKWHFIIACQDGHLEVLKWLRSEGCPWSEMACPSAARGGHLEALRWLRSEGCPWNERTCSGAAEKGHLDVLKYLLENGCPWDEWTWLSASESVKEWLRQNGVIWVTLM